MANEPNVINVSNCGSDERSAYTGGKAGDQYGSEWSIRPWSVYRTGGWNCVLRHPDVTVRNMMADMAVQAANNDNIGYDQLQRETFWEELKKVNYVPANITTPCEADCSSGVCAIVKGVGYKLNRPELQNIPITSTPYMRSIFASAGFEVLTDSKYLTTPNNLVTGDVMLSDLHHTNIVVTSNNSVTTPTYYDISKLKPYVVLIDRNTTSKVTQAMIDKGVVGAIVEAGYLYNSDRTDAKDKYNPRFEQQIKNLEEMNVPYGMLWYSRAANLIEAKQEANWFSYTLRSHHPRLGAWVGCYFPDVNTVMMNDNILQIYQDKLIDLGYVNQIGVYGTPKQLKKTTLSALQEHWVVWMNNHIANTSELQHMLDSKFFQVGV